MFTKIPTSLSDCYIIESQVFWDARGFFMETYSTVEFAKIGIDSVFVQDNHSKSKKWVLRGLHFQTRKPQAKLVRVTAGSVYDVVVDLRVGSPTFGKWEGFVLSAENQSMLFVPRGFAHGFLTLEDDTEFLYKCDDVYDSGYEGGVMWDDPTLQIDWDQYCDISYLEISAKDQQHPTFASLDIENIFPKVYSKQWDIWHTKKQKLDKKEKKVSVKEGDLWWVHCGLNIWFEIDGKWDMFTRPCIIYKKLTGSQFLVIPASTKTKEWSWYVPYRHQGIDSIACLQQIKVIDAKRLFEKMGQMDTTDMHRIREAFTVLYT